MHTLKFRYINGPFSQEILMKFLQEETFPSSKELLVMHFLQRGRYVEGIRLNELMKKDKLVCILLDTS